MLYIYLYKYSYGSSDILSFTYPGAEFRFVWITGRLEMETKSRFREIRLGIVYGISRWELLRVGNPRGV